MNDFVTALAQSLFRDDSITAVGLSSNPLPEKPEDGDIDIFVYCRKIPSIKKRTPLYDVIPHDDNSLKKRCFVSRNWGDADFLTLRQVETWIMYFTEAAVRRDIELIVSGRQFRRNNGYYPTGRLQMFRNMQILAERDGFITRLKDELAIYPPALKAAILADAVEAADDEEDLLRAVHRKDVLFYHVSIDDALDNLLQIEYALNDVLFPSRKRTEDIVRTFRITPADMYSEMCRIIHLGADAQTLGESFALYRKLKREVVALYRANRVHD